MVHSFLEPLLMILNFCWITLPHFVSYSFTPLDYYLERFNMQRLTYQLLIPHNWLPCMSQISILRFARINTFSLYPSEILLHSVSCLWTKFLGAMQDLANHTHCIYCEYEIGKRLYISLSRAMSSFAFPTLRIGST